MWRPALYHITITLKKKLLYKAKELQIFYELEGVREQTTQGQFINLFIKGRGKRTKDTDIRIYLDTLSDLIYSKF